MKKPIPIAVAVLIILGIAGYCLLNPGYLPGPLRIFMAKGLMDAAARSNNYSGDFYGRCVDQSGAGVPGVIIQMDYAVDEGFMHRRPVNLNATSDSEGRFQFTGLYGLSFYCHDVEKPGYYSWVGRPVFEFDPKSPHYYVGDPARPEIIQMWRRGPEEPFLHHGDNDFVPPDGTPYSFNFFEPDASLHVGRSPNASIVISAKNVHREKFKDSRKYEPTDWVLTVDVLGGGLIETSETFPYRAPETGYIPHWELTISASDPNWKEVKKHFYVKLQNGKAYGIVRVNATMDPISDKVNIDTGGSINTAGSRNLEPGGKDITPR